MSESKFTPGPWMASGTKALGVAEVTAPEQDHPRFYICSIPYSPTPPPNPDREANARLIAAAPDLLEVCRRLLVEPDETFANPDKVLAELVPIWKAAKAAVAKATGGSPT